MGLSRGGPWNAFSDGLASLAGSVDVALAGRTLGSVVWPGLLPSAGHSPVQTTAPRLRSGRRCPGGSAGCGRRRGGLPAGRETAELPLAGALLPERSWPDCFCPCEVADRRAATADWPEAIARPARAWRTAPQQPAPQQPAAGSTGRWHRANQWPAAARGAARTAQTGPPCCSCPGIPPAVSSPKAA